MTRRGFAKTIGLIAVVVIVIGVLAYAIIQPNVGWPREDRRVVHPAGGFSVVQPLNWEKHVLFDMARRSPDVLKFLPIKSVGSPGSFIVTRLIETPTEAALAARGYRPTTFLGNSAYERWFSSDLTREHARGLVFERDGAWFDISIRRPQSEPIDAGVWKAYAESFRIEKTSYPPALPVATTAPAAAATTKAAP